MKLLQGKAVVITGSGRGIGAACAKGVARQGAAVVVNDVDAGEANKVAEEIRTDGGNAITAIFDIADWDQAGKLIGACIDTFGRIDGLVNNAGLFQIGRIDEFDPVSTRAVVDVNVIGPLYCAGHAVKPMLAQGTGAIINVVSGAHMGMPTMGVYGATKGAVASMVYTWAMELAGTGVRVNGLSPFGATRMMRQAMGYQGDEVSKQRFAAIQSAEANAPVVEYLLSDRAAHVNGQIVRIDKGELQLYTHPALLMPPIVRTGWTAEDVANVFDNELKDRFVPCGVMGMEHLPVDMKSGFWRRAQSS